jgi:Xaa-Pro aminopeptidase
MSAAAAEAGRLDELLAADRRGLALLDRIEAAGLIAAGRSEREVEEDIRILAREEFGVERHWHDRHVRAGANTLAVAGETVPLRTIAEDDMVFVDLGPVFAEWEADVGRSYAVGGDPAKRALRADLDAQFDAVHRHFLANPAITGAELYAFACASAEQAGWRYGGKIAGHIVGEYNHRDWPGDRNLARIGPLNPTPLSGPDHLGRERYWILEIHLVEPGGGFAGFYERLMHPATADAERTAPRRSARR